MTFFFSVRTERTTVGLFWIRLDEIADIYKHFSTRRCCLCDWFLTDCLICYWKKVGYEFSCEVGFYFHRLAADSASFPSVFLQMRVNYEFARDCLSCQKVTVDWVSWSADNRGAIVSNQFWTAALTQAVHIGLHIIFLCVRHKPVQCAFSSFWYAELYAENAVEPSSGRRLNAKWN